VWAINFSFTSPLVSTFQHGFYGPEWNGEKVSAEDEAGEALTVSDPFETW
jgi:hypothetical protein